MALFHSQTRRHIMINLVRETTWSQLWPIILLAVYYFYTFSFCDNGQTILFVKGKQSLYILFWNHIDYVTGLGVTYQICYKYGLICSSNFCNDRIWFKCTWCDLNHWGRMEANEPGHEISKKVVCATSKVSDQPAHTRSLIWVFDSLLNIYGSQATDWNSFWVSKLKERPHRLVLVYTCQNVTLLESTCRGSHGLKLQMSRNMKFPTMWYVRPARSQISMRIRAVWSEPLLFAHWKVS